MTFFEIDPANEAVARSFFSFLKNSRGPVDVIPGDGRLSLRQAAKSPLKYHLIVIDAFSGDGIPAHLLTREAIQSYLDCLTDDGLLLFHISNRYFNLTPVLKAAATELNLPGCANDKFSRTDLRKYDINPACVLFAKKNKTLQALINQGWIPFGPGDGLQTVTAWSDDYINIIDPLLAKFSAPISPPTRAAVSPK
jgi:spermidine synthase